MDKYVIGVDVGTTGTKAMVVDLSGKNYGSSYRDYPFVHPKPDWVQLGARNLTEQVITVVAEAVQKSGVDVKNIASISFSVQRSTFTLVDESGEALEDSIIVWLDQRAEEVIAEMNSLMDPEYRATITGMPSVAVFAIAKLYWIKKNLPKLYEKAKYFATVDGYIMNQFGSDKFCNEVTSAQVCGLIDVRTMDWCYEAIDALGLSRDLMPPLVKPCEIVGKISEYISKRTGLTRDTLIVGGAGDQQAGALGAGIIHDGDVSITMGTGGFVIVGAAKPKFAELKGLIVASTPNIGVFEVEGNQNSGATCYRWARDTFFSTEAQVARDAGMDPYDLMEKLIEKSQPGSNGLLFGAALFGTGYPTWNNAATGTFAGLKPTHTKADILRSVIEGVTLETRFMLETIRNTGVETNLLFTITGGATKSATWRQVIADIMGTTCRTLDVSDASVIGVAGLAAIGAGLYNNLQEVVDNMVHYKETIEPDEKNIEIYNRAFESYKKLYLSLNDNGVYTSINNINK